MKLLEAVLLGLISVGWCSINIYEGVLPPSPPATPAPPTPPALPVTPAPGPPTVPGPPAVPAPTPPPPIPPFHNETGCYCNHTMCNIVVWRGDLGVGGNNFWRLFGNWHDYLGEAGRSPPNADECAYFTDSLSPECEVTGDVTVKGIFISNQVRGLKITMANVTVQDSLIVEQGATLGFYGTYPSRKNDPAGYPYSTLVANKATIFGTLKFGGGALGGVWEIAKQASLHFLGSKPKALLPGNSPWNCTVLINRGEMRNPTNIPWQLYAGQWARILNFGDIYLLAGSVIQGLPDFSAPGVGVFQRNHTLISLEGRMHYDALPTTTEMTPIGLQLDDMYLDSANVTSANIELRIQPALFFRMTIKTATIAEQAALIVSVHDGAGVSQGVAGGVEIENLNCDGRFRLEGKGYAVNSKGIFRVPNGMELLGTLYVAHSFSSKSIELGPGGGLHFIHVGGKKDFYQATTPNLTMSGASASITGGVVKASYINVGCWANFRLDDAILEGQTIIVSRAEPNKSNDHYPYSTDGYTWTMQNDARLRVLPGGTFTVENPFHVIGCGYPCAYIENNGDLHLTMKNQPNDGDSRLFQIDSAHWVGHGDMYVAANGSLYFATPKLFFQQRRLYFDCVNKKHPDAPCYSGASGTQGYLGSPDDTCGAKHNYVVPVGIRNATILTAGKEETSTFGLLTTFAGIQTLCMPTCLNITQVPCSYQKSNGVSWAFLVVDWARANSYGPANQAKHLLPFGPNYIPPLPPPPSPPPPSPPPPVTPVPPAVPIIPVVPAVPVAPAPPAPTCYATKKTPLTLTGLGSAVFGLVVGFGLTCLVYALVSFAKNAKARKLALLKDKDDVSSSASFTKAAESPYEPVGDIDTASASENDRLLADVPGTGYQSAGYKDPPPMHVVKEKTSERESQHDEATVVAPSTEHLVDTVVSKPTQQADEATVVATDAPTVTASPTTPKSQDPPYMPPNVPTGSKGPKSDASSTAPSIPPNVPTGSKGPSSVASSGAPSMPPNIPTGSKGPSSVASSGAPSMPPNIPTGSKGASSVTSSGAPLMPPNIPTGSKGPSSVASGGSASPSVGSAAPSTASGAPSAPPTMPPNVPTGSRGPGSVTSVGSGAPTGPPSSPPAGSNIPRSPGSAGSAPSPQSTPKQAPTSTAAGSAYSMYKPPTGPPTGLPTGPAPGITTTPPTSSGVLASTPQPTYRTPTGTPGTPSSHSSSPFMGGGTPTGPSALGGSAFGGAPTGPPTGPPKHSSRRAAQPGFGGAGAFGAPAPTNNPFGAPPSRPPQGGAGAFGKPPTAPPRGGGGW